jgi:hypothetical protein
MCASIPALAGGPTDLLSLDTEQRIGWHPGRDAPMHTAVRLESLTCELAPSRLSEPPDLFRWDQPPPQVGTEMPKVPGSSGRRCSASILTRPPLPPLLRGKPRLQVRLCLTQVGKTKQRGHETLRQARPDLGTAECGGNWNGRCIGEMATVRQKHCDAERAAGRM